MSQAPLFGEDVPEIIRTIDAQQQKIRSISAAFTQVRRTSLAREPLASAGWVKFQRPNRIHFIYTRPEEMEMALDGKTVWIYYPGRFSAEKISLTRNRRAARYMEPVTQIFEKTFAQLEEAYTMNFVGLEGNRTYLFRLEPREPGKELPARVDLGIDKETGVILKFDMVQPNQDRLSLEFKEVKINPPLSDAELAIGIPPSVRIQEQNLP